MPFSDSIFPYSRDFHTSYSQWRECAERNPRFSPRYAFVWLLRKEKKKKYEIVRIQLVMIWFRSSFDFCSNSKLFSATKRSVTCSRFFVCKLIFRSFVVFVSFVTSYGFTMRWDVESWMLYWSWILKKVRSFRYVISGFWLVDLVKWLLLKLIFLV